MVRQARAAGFEDVARPVIAVGNDYPAGHVHPTHSHRRGQLLHAATGTMVVSTAHGAWVVPPQQAIWIPGGVPHGIRMIGTVRTRSVYVEPEAAPDWPVRCRVISVSPLLHSLLCEAVDLPVEYAPGSRAELVMSLLLRDIGAATELPLCLPFPHAERLARHCRGFLDRPSARRTIDDWCEALGMSRRALTRAFRRDTGLSVGAWQRRACLLAALPRLVAGEPVTTIALDLGYADPAAFTTMFKRLLGAPPSRYRQPAGGVSSVGGLTSSRRR
jgi:AraC-like DNA-binding protein/mannose-6-phosphate isomerase-like protein (cupin superfamily)